MGIRAICREVGVSRKAVRRALRLDGTPRYSRPQRPNPKLVPFEAEIRRLYFTEHLIGSRILREVRPAYTGSASALYTYLKGLRASVPSSKATERFETPPGFQAQFDWSPYTIDLGGELFRVIVFCMVLGYSRRKHYTASLDETQASIFEAVESCLRHFGASPKQLLIDNAKAFVLDPNPAHFRWNPQFLELCGHYRIRPRACQPYRAQTKGKVERPFFYLEQQFIKGTHFASFSHFLEELAVFERDDLDVRVHSTTLERPIDRFQQELPHLTPLRTALRGDPDALAQGQLGLPGQLRRQSVLGPSHSSRQVGVAAAESWHACAGVGRAARSARPTSHQRRQRRDRHPAGTLRAFAPHGGQNLCGARRAVPRALSAPGGLPRRSGGAAQDEPCRSPARSDGTGQPL